MGPLNIEGGNIHKKTVVKHLVKHVAKHVVKHVANQMVKHVAKVCGVTINLNRSIELLDHSSVQFIEK